MRTFSILDRNFQFKTHCIAVYFYPVFKQGLFGWPVLTVCKDIHGLKMLAFAECIKTSGNSALILQNLQIYLVRNLGKGLSVKNTFKGEKYLKFCAAVFNRFTQSVLFIFYHTIICFHAYFLRGRSLQYNS